MDNSLQQNKHLIESKSEKNLHDEERLHFIEGIHILRERLNEKIKSQHLDREFEKYLSLHLEKRTDLTNEDKIHILNNARIEDLRLLQIYELAYASGEERDRWFFKSVSRIPTMMRFYKKVITEDREFIKTIQKYHFKKLQDMASWRFKSNAAKWGLKDIVSGIDELEKKSQRAGLGGKAQIDQLYKTAQEFKVETKEWGEKGAVPLNELNKHDQILRQYHALVMRATKLMSEKAKEVIDSTRYVEAVRKSKGEAFWGTKIKDMNLSEQTLSKIFPGVDVRNVKGMTGANLATAIAERAVDLRNMQDITQTRFAALAETINENVAKPFGTKWESKLEIFKGKKEHQRISEQVQRIEDAAKARKGKYYLKKFGLPAIIVGTEVYDLATGKAKKEEVMWDLVEAGAGFVPVVGTALDFKGAITGKSLSGKNLSKRERLMYLGFGTIGLVADGALLLGGLGLYLREGLGGIRAARRSVQVGAEMNTLREAAAIEKESVLQRTIGRGAKLFDKGHQAEKAVEAQVTAKAYEQARLMSKYNIKDLSSLEKEIFLTKDGKKMEELKKLRELMQGTATGGRSYMEIFEHISKGGLKIPETFLGRGWLRTKESFKQMSVFLRTKLGVSPRF